MQFAKSRGVQVAALLSVAAAASAAGLTGIADPNPRLPGITEPSLVAVGLRQSIVAEGSMPLENPSPGFAFYGFNDDGPHVPAAGALPSATGPVIEATKTEPDKNTYLILQGLHGADASYDYGSHFLFQGHENGAGGKSFLSRVNLDADGAHRVTLLASTETGGAALPPIDGSTWDPFAKRLLFTNEGNGTTSGGVWQATPDIPSAVVNLLGVIGRGGFEGVQVDPSGNLWLVEDIGGSTVGGAKVSNSFIYRFVPKNRWDLTQGGKLQALQVSELNGSGPIVFNSASSLTQELKDLHTYGNVFDTSWVTVHDTDADGTAVFNANALAKAKMATPFKRPENGLFRPGIGFREFYFTETGDTSAASTGNTDFGGFGGIYKLSQSSPTADHGKLTLFFKGDLEHTSFDNISFWDVNHVVAVEDRGDTLHAQANALDSGWLFDVRANFAGGAQPIRIIACGRDSLATLDGGFAGMAGFQNEGDNEITGIHVSDGDASIAGLLGVRAPHPFDNGWRVFYTQQHGENATYEILEDESNDNDHGHAHQWRFP
jgi:hypothetical protein